MITTSKITHLFEGAKTLMHTQEGTELPAKEWVFFTENSHYMATLPLEIIPVTGKNITVHEDWICKL